MSNNKTLSCICALLLVSSPVAAQNTPPPHTPPRPVKVSADSVAQARKAAAKVFRGITLGTDLSGAVLAAASSWGQAEVDVRVNLKNKFFPLVELGYGFAHPKDKDTQLQYKMASPYGRVGVNYNFLHKKSPLNRIYLGIRAAYSPYRFQISGPPLIDPFYGGSIPVSEQKWSGHQVWGELVFGVGTQLWKFIDIGWNVRYKMRFSQKRPEYGSPQIVPGYGKNGQHAFGGSFNIYFNL